MLYLKLGKQDLCGAQMEQHRAATLPRYTGEYQTPKKKKRRIAIISHIYCENQPKKQDANQPN